MSNSKKVELYRQAHRLVKKLKRKSIEEMDILDTTGVTRGEFRALLVLNSDKGISLGEIANGWSMQNSNITTTVRLLVEKGFAIKKKDSEDKRVTKVFITQKGEELRSLIITEFDRKIDENLAKVSSEKISTALAAINDILEQL